MASYDVFVSYKKSDRPTVAKLAAALKDQGWSVWWDQKIPPGRTWAQVIEAAIRCSRCVIVLWSQASVTSEWVHKEARLANRLGLLVPALIERVDVPFEFEHLHAADLVGWQGESNDALAELFDELRSRLQVSPVANAATATDASVTGGKSIQQSSIGGTARPRRRANTVVPSERQAPGARVNSGEQSNITNVKTALPEEAMVSVSSRTRNSALRSAAPPAHSAAIPSGRSAILLRYLGVIAAFWVITVGLSVVVSKTIPAAFDIDHAMSPLTLIIGLAGGHVAGTWSMLNDRYRTGAWDYAKRCSAIGVTDVILAICLQLVGVESLALVYVTSAAIILVVFAVKDALF